MATIAVILGGISPPAFGQTGWPPRQSGANIGGKEGMLFYPRDETGPIEPRKCVVQLAPMDALTTRFTYPCGEWFLPPGPGSYRSWIEMEGRISGAQTILRDNGEERFTGQGFVVLHETVVAGYVSAPQDVPPGHTVRYLSLDSPSFGFSLRVPAASASQPAPMPPGRVVAGIFREDTDEAVAHSRSMSVEPGKTTEFRIDPPSTGSDLLVMLRKPPAPPVDGKAALRVRYASGEREADVVHESPGWFVVLWYGLPATTVNLYLDSSAFTLPETAIQLATGKVTTVRKTLKRTTGRSGG